jgi:hypothetical protein
MKIIEPTTYSMFNLNEIIRAINDNFIEIEKKINENVSENKILNFDEFKEFLIFFNDYNKTVSIKIADGFIFFKTDDKTFKYNISSGNMEEVNE